MIINVVFNQHSNHESKIIKVFLQAIKKRRGLTSIHACIYNHVGFHWSIRKLAAHVRNNNENPTNEITGKGPSLMESWKPLTFNAIALKTSLAPGPIPVFPSLSFAKICHSTLNFDHYLFALATAHKSIQK